MEWPSVVLIVVIIIFFARTTSSITVNYVKPLNFESTTASIHHVQTCKGHVSLSVSIPVI